jgi:hypothetical protein
MFVYLEYDYLWHVSYVGQVRWQDSSPALTINLLQHKFF